MTNNDDKVKLQPDYDGDLMRRYVAYFEMFAELMKDETLSEQKRKVAGQLCAHYRRMIICMAMKNIPEGFCTNDVLHLREVFVLLNENEEIK